MGEANTYLQDIVKALFADPDMNSTHRLAAVNSINWARILAQITYYFHAYFSVCRNTSSSNPAVRFVVPTGNFGDILAGYFATRMGLPSDKLVIATNENDILHRFWQTGRYEKQPSTKANPQGEVGGFPNDGAKAHPSGVKETLAPAMDILVSSNFERLLWFLAYRTSSAEETNNRRMEAGQKVQTWLNALKSDGGFAVNDTILSAAKETFASERVSDTETLETIKDVYSWSLPASTQQSNRGTSGTLNQGHYILDPHSAIGVAASLRSISQNDSGKSLEHVSLATAHPAKFANAVELALKDQEGFAFETVLPEQFFGLEKMEKRVTEAEASWEGVRELVRREVEEEMAAGKR